MVLNEGPGADEEAAAAPQPPPLKRRCASEARGEGGGANSGDHPRIARLDEVSAGQQWLPKQSEPEEHNYYPPYSSLHAAVAGCADSCADAIADLPPGPIDDALMRVLAGALADRGVATLPRRGLERAADLLRSYMHTLAGAARRQAHVSLRSRVNSYDVARAFAQVDGRRFRQAVAAAADGGGDEEGDSRAGLAASGGPESHLAAAHCNLPVVRNFTRAAWPEGTLRAPEALERARERWSLVGEREAEEGPAAPGASWIDEVWVARRNSEVRFAGPAAECDYVGGGAAPAAPGAAAGAGLSPPLPAFLAARPPHLRAGPSPAGRAAAGRAAAGPRYGPRDRGAELEDRLFVQLALPEIVDPLRGAEEGGE